MVRRTRKLLCSIISHSMAYFDCIFRRTSSIDKTNMGILDKPSLLQVPNCLILTRDRKYPTTRGLAVERHWSLLSEFKEWLDMNTPDYYINTKISPPWNIGFQSINDAVLAKLTWGLQDKYD